MSLETSTGLIFSNTIQAKRDLRCYYFSFVGQNIIHNRLERNKPSMWFTASLQSVVKSNGNTGTKEAESVFCGCWYDLHEYEYSNVWVTESQVFISRTNEHRKPFLLQQLLIWTPEGSDMKSRTHAALDPEPSSWHPVDPLCLSGNAAAWLAEEEEGEELPSVSLGPPSYCPSGVLEARGRFLRAVASVKSREERGHHDGQHPVQEPHPGENRWACLLIVVFYVVLLLWWQQCVVLSINAVADCLMFVSPWASLRILTPAPPPPSIRERPIEDGSEVSDILSCVFIQTLMGMHAYAACSLAPDGLGCGISDNIYVSDQHLLFFLSADVRAVIPASFMNAWWSEGIHAITGWSGITDRRWWSGMGCGWVVFHF